MLFTTTITILILLSALFVMSYRVATILSIAKKEQTITIFNCIIVLFYLWLVSELTKSIIGYLVINY